ncbi:MAG: hypothetical protein KY462_09010 [Actinobacteria bacterium]|nr:hypothetical protein [Actinomycetota bacterium]
MSSASPASGPFTRLLDAIPNWVGFGLIILVGVVLVIVGALGPNGGAIAFGVATVISAIIAWVSGARSQPRVDPFKRRFGGTVKEIDQLPWIVIFGLYVIALVVSLVTA